MDGIIAVAATPFTKENEIDLVSLRRYVHSCLERGVSGFAAPAMAGEVYELTDEERCLVVTTILEENAGKVPVIGGTSAPDAESRLRNARRMIALGCDGIIAYVPYENSAALADEYRRLADLGPGFIMLQDLDWEGRKLPVEVIASLFGKIACLTWIKTEVADRSRKISAIRAACGSAIKIATAGPEMIENLDRGADAYMPTLYHDIYTRVYRLYREGKRDQATSLFRRLLPNLVFHTTHGDIAHVMNKAMLKREGTFDTDRIRIKQAVPDVYEERIMLELVERALRLSEEIAKERI